jgi:hypothetical protein
LEKSHSLPRFYNNGNGSCISVRLHLAPEITGIRRNGNSARIGVDTGISRDLSMEMKIPRLLGNKRK